MNNKMNRIVSAIKDPKIKVVSFDVFDTLVLRPFWKPVDLFMFLDKEASDLFNTADIIRFSEFRRCAEQEARDQVRKQGKEDLTITDIYRYLEENSPFPKEILDALMQKEKDLEQRFCYARKSTQQLLNAAVNAGKKVIAVSDMYLTADFIRAILEHCGITQIERIYVSSDVGLTKRTGHLYEYVAKEMNVNYREIVHIGDNAKTDVQVPKKMNIRAFYYPRTIKLMSKGSTGRAYRHAYEEIRSSSSNYHATEELGIRCMLAVAANRVFDDPFRDVKTGNDYSGDTVLFGNLALGMYGLSHGLWVYQMSQEKKYDHVLFFARDGYLPYLAFKLIRKQESKKDVPEPAYVRVSRKSLLPLLLANEKNTLKICSHIRYLDHSPKSLVRLMSPALKEHAEVSLKKEAGSLWEKAFKSDLDLVNYMHHLYAQFVDDERMKNVLEGFRAYFEPLMKGKVLTYDIGYSIRPEIILHEYFPEVSFDACITHYTSDDALKRASQGGINLHLFYSSTPYVSCLPRELFLAENAPGCVGYAVAGNPVMETKKEADPIIREMQKHAAAYIEEFVSVFGADIINLPLQPANACHPYETFLHSPGRGDRRWVRKLNADNDAASGIRMFENYKFWRRVRVDYWAANHHMGKYGRYMALTLLLLLTDRYDLQKTINKRLPHKVKKMLEK